MFNKIFGKKESNKNIESEYQESIEFDLRMLWLHRELEFQHQNEKLQFRINENESIKFGEIINSLFDIRKEELSTLSINDGTLLTIENEQEIWDYEFLQHYKRNDNGEYIYYKKGCSNLANQIVLTLGYRSQDKIYLDKDKSLLKSDALLIVHLQYPEGQKEKVLYVQTSFFLPTPKFERTKNGINPQPQSLSLLIGIDYSSNEDITKEFYSIFNSAKEKVSSKKFSELDYLESQLLELLYHPQIAKEYYLGKNVLNKNRFWDAIGHFENVFKALQSKWWNEQLSNEEFNILAESSFLIGFCYYELGLFDKSFKYLEFCTNTGKSNYKYITEYINCLIALKDIRALMIIDEQSTALINKKTEERTEDDFEFQLFLIRRRCYCLLELNQFDKAEEGLKYLLSIEPENQFALQELEYIKKINKTTN